MTYYSVLIMKISVNIIFGREKSVPVSKETYPYSVGKDIESGIYTSEKAKVGTAGYLLELESTRAIKVCASFIID